MVLASGGQDGAICLWDVLTGSRVSHVYGHRGDVTSLVCTTSCIISSGLDDLICIWDRSTGIKLYSIQQVRFLLRNAPISRDRPAVAFFFVLLQISVISQFHQQGVIQKLYVSHLYVQFSC